MDVLEKCSSDPLSPIVDDVVVDGEDEHQVDEIYTKLAHTLFGETQSQSLELIDLLRKEIERRQWKVPKCHRYLLKMLRAGGFDWNEALNTMENYFLHFQERPQYFQNIGMNLAEKVLAQQMQTILLHRDQFGRRILLLRTEHWDPDTLSYPDLFCVGYMLCELMSLEQKNQIAGVTCIVDLTGYGFNHMRKFTLDDVKSSIALIQSSFPLWFRALHMINSPWLFNTTFNLIRPMLSERIKNNLFFHDSLDDLYAHVDPSILPEEL
eukprot:maker-scaffold426_size175065-snap-gene-0.47 protein:Tk08647 transcript:maker-scaffold426_size175065-snap-gene-0.47-mRNA-1 annotation:"alpha-tocopherol transfer protein"